MASKHTEHYGLSLWAPGDKFLREEFNGDHERVEAGLSALEDKTERALGGLVPLNYHVCNLLLQAYYEGKETGYRRAVVFDGFLDGTGVKALGGAMVLGAGGPCVCRTGQGGVDLGYGSYGNGSSQSTADQTAAGTGRLSGMSCRLNNNYNQNDRTAAVTCTVTVNGKTAAAKTVDTPKFSAFGSQELRISLDEPVALCPGDRFSVALRTGASDWRFALSEGGVGLGGAVQITPVSGNAGTLTTAEHALPACGEVRAWVRHTGGRVSLTVGGRAMECVEERDTVDVMGRPCRETGFRAEGWPESGARGFALGLTLGDGEENGVVLDYGAVMM